MFVQKLRKVPEFLCAIISNGIKMRRKKCGQTKTNWCQAEFMSTPDCNFGIFVTLILLLCVPTWHKHNHMKQTIIKWFSSIRFLRLLTRQCLCNAQMQAQQQFFWSHWLAKARFCFNVTQQSELPALPDFYCSWREQPARCHPWWEEISGLTKPWIKYGALFVCVHSKKV